MHLIPYVIALLVYLNDACEEPFVEVDKGCYFCNPELFTQSYDSASEFCQGMGSYLAVVKSGEENRGIIDVLLAPNVIPDRMLLGATRNDLGLFEWVDGTLVRDSFNAWEDGEPNTGGFCMGYSKDHNLFWENFQCDNYASSNMFVGFVCEKDVVTTTTTTSTTTTTPTTTTTTPTTTTTTPTTTTTTPKTTTTTPTTTTTTPTTTTTSTTTTTTPTTTTTTPTTTTTTTAPTTTTTTTPTTTTTTPTTTTTTTPTTTTTTTPTTTTTTSTTTTTTPTTTTTTPTTTTTTATTTTTPVECPDGFTDLGTGCYHVFEQEVTFGPANDYCNSLGAHLSYITSPEEQIAIGLYLNNNNINEWTWIGGYDRFDNDVYYWLDGTPIEDDYTNWAIDEPDGGNHDFMYIRDNENWEWGDDPYSATKYALCEIDK